MGAICIILNILEVTLKIMKRQMKFNYFIKSSMANILFQHVSNVKY